MRGVDKLVIDPVFYDIIKNIIAYGELNKNQVISKMEIIAADGKSYNKVFYNLQIM
jgi:hypothetical protein